MHSYFQSKSFPSEVFITPNIPPNDKKFKITDKANNAIN